MPAADVIAVVTLAVDLAAGLQRRGPALEVGEVAARPRRRAAVAGVLVVADGRVADTLVLAPARLVDLVEGAQLPAVVLLVTERQDHVGPREQVGGGGLVALGGRPGSRG